MFIEKTRFGAKKPCAEAKELLRERLLYLLDLNEQVYLLKPIDDAILFDIEKNGVQYMIKRTEEALTICFRGSDAFKDYVTDVQFWKMKVPYNNTSSKIRVHTGFINAYKSEDVRENISSFVDDKVKKIVITGHSYGGALALLCGVDLQYNFHCRDIEVVVFGSPRVGNRAFAKSYNKRVSNTLRVENSNDLVTKLPFRILGYADAGTRLHIGFPRIFFVFSIRAHSLSSYYKQLTTKPLRHLKCEVGANPR